MIYLSDNDIVEKLAVCDLLDDGLAALSATRPEVYVIPTLKLRIGGKSREKAEKRLGEPAVSRILDFLESTQVIREYSRASAYRKSLEFLGLRNAKRAILPEFSVSVSVNRG